MAEEKQPHDMSKEFKCDELDLLWTEEDQERAEQQGWVPSQIGTDTTPVFEIERIDEPSQRKFDSDDDAILHVVAMARFDKTCAKALLLVAGLFTVNLNPTQK